MEETYFCECIPFLSLCLNVAVSNLHTIIRYKMDAFIFDIFDIWKEATNFIAAR